MTDTDQQINERVARARWPTAKVAARKGATAVDVIGNPTVHIDGLDLYGAVYDPTTDWRDCGPLLEEWISATNGIIERYDYETEGIGWVACDGAHKPILATCSAPDKLTRAICIAWLAWKEPAQ